MTTDRERNRRFRRALAEELKKSVRIQTATHDEIKRLLQVASARVRAALAASPTDFAVWRLTRVQDELRAAMATFETEGAAVLRTGIDRSWAAGGELVTAPLAAGGIDLSGRLVALDPRLLTAMQAFMTDKARDLSVAAANKVNTEIALSVMGVQTPFEAAAKVVPVFDGVADRARSVVRTELGAAYSAAGQQRMAQAIAAGVAGLQKQWRRSGKLHPRVTHELADGQIVDVDRPFLVGGIEIDFPRAPTCPVGERINCGCASLPYMKHWAMRRPGAQPYTAEELARSPSARQAGEVRDEMARRRQR